MGSWLEVYFPKRRVIAKIAEVNENVISVVRDGKDVKSIRKGIEIIHLADSEKPYAKQRLDKHDDYTLAEMTLRIDCLRPTDSTMRDVLKKLK